MISILGAGAIGQLLAHKLTDASIDCQLIVRNETNYSNDWQFITDDNTSSERSFNITSTDDRSQLDIIAVTVKSPQLESALLGIKHRLTPHSQVVLFQNGMGHESIASTLLAPENVFFASNTHGAFKLDKQSIRYAGEGQLLIGSLEDNVKQAPHWFECFEETNLAAQWSNDIPSVLYRKLLVNAVINPLTALYQCKNGDLLTPSKKQRLLELVQENSNFAESIQLTFESSFKELVINVIEATADNYNSMYQDVNAGVTTEIEAINGYLLDEMSKHNFQGNHNRELWSDFHISFPPLRKKAQERAKQFDTMQYQVTQQAGTERPFTGTYNVHSETGDYSCACCDSHLFDDKGKFDSHCGWPSFDRAKNNKAIAYRQDNAHNMSRTEILCAQCGSHLGHVFEDGPTETRVRFCVNSASLNFSGTTE